MINIVLLILLYNLVMSRFSRGDILSCGLVAYSGKQPFDLDKIKLLLYMNSIERGKDATGIYTPTRGIVKDAIEAKDFIPRISDLKPDTLFMGHVRSGTIGSNTILNAHPHLNSGVVAIHNGTLDNHWSLCTKHDLDLSEFHTDSQVLTALLAKYQNTKILEEILGSAAVIWSRFRSNSLFVYRNKDRELYRGKIDGGMYISSIEKSLKMIGCTSVMEIKEDYCYSIFDGEIDRQFKVKRAVPVSTKVDFSKVDDQDYQLVGRWLKCEMENYSYANSVVKPCKRGKYYLVREATAHNMLVVEDENGSLMRPAHKKSFDLKNSGLTVGDFAVAMANLVTVGENPTSICKKGKIFLVTEDHQIFIKTVRDLLTNETYALKIKHLRRAEDSEIMDDTPIDEANCALNDSCSVPNSTQALTDEDHEDLMDNMYVPSEIIHDVLEDISTMVDKLKIITKNDLVTYDVVEQLEEIVMESYSTVTDAQIVLEDVKEDTE